MRRTEKYEVNNDMDTIQDELRCIKKYRNGYIYKVIRIGTEGQRCYIE